MNEYLKSWSNPNSLEFYRKNRNKKEDLYESERLFISKILKPGIKILDVGCGAGGFYNILKSYEPDIEYFGIDSCEELIREAKKINQKIKFKVGEGKQLPYKSNYFDLVLCFGTLHMNLDWRDIIEECWRVTKNNFLFDLRITDKESIEDMSKSYQKIMFEEEWDKKSKVPYVIVNANHTMKLLNNLSNLKRITMYGYSHPVSKTAVTPYNEVFMTVFLANKKRRLYENSG